MASAPEERGSSRRMTPPETVVDAAPGSRYCSFVDPGHPLIDTLQSSISTAGGAAIEKALQVMEERFVYQTTAGHRGMNEVLHRSRQTDGPIEINCIDSVCIVVSLLRRLGVEADAVFVALAGVRGLLHHHAWGLLRWRDRFLWIDPVDLRTTEISGREILHLYDVYVIFSDQYFAFTRDSKRQLLLEAAA